MDKQAILNAIESFEENRVKCLRCYDNFVEYIDNPRQYNQAVASNNAINNSIDELRKILKDVIIANGYTLKDLQSLCECQFTNPTRYSRFINQLLPLKGVKNVLNNCQYYNRLRQKHSIFVYMSDTDKQLILKYMNKILLSNFNNTYRLGFIIRLDKEN